MQTRSFQTDGYDVDLIIRKRTLLEERVHEGIFMYFLTEKKSKEQHIVIDQELVRIYAIKDLQRIMAGRFKLLKTFGDFDIKKNYDADRSKRMVAIFRKI